MLAPGDHVIYTAAGVKATQPSDPRMVGEVREVEDYQVAVFWPAYGCVGLEAPDHVRKVQT